MNARIHLNNSQLSLFLNIGNVTVWNSSESGEITIELNNTYLDTLLDYSEFINKTTPLRLGALNQTQSNGTLARADVILITDTSGSMDWRLNVDGSSGTDRNCSDPNLWADSTKRISLAKCLDMEFVTTILTNPNNRVGLVSFSTSANNFLNLTNNITLINSTVRSYTATGSTCLSCAINRAYTLLQTQSNSSTPKFIVTMTDGVANVRSTPYCYNLGGASNNVTGVREAVQTGIAGAIVDLINGTWSAVSSPTTTNLNAVNLLNDTFGFAVGESYQIFRRNATGWGLINDLGSSALYGIDLLNSTWGFAVGSSGKIARFNGTAWSELQDMGSSNILDSAFANSTFALSVGTAGKVYNWSGRTTGSPWSELQDTGNNDFYTLDFWNTTYGFAGDDSADIYVWNGTQFNFNATVGSGTINDIVFVNATNVLAADSDGNVYQKIGQSAWSLVYSGSYQLKSIVLVNSTLIFAVGDSREGIVFWDGSTWANKFEQYFFEGNSSTGISCNDNGDCSLTQSIPMLNANYSACRAHSDQNATIHAIGFGPTATCGLSTATLQAVASCGNGQFYASSDAGQLQQIYQAIASNITTSYSGQTISTTSTASGQLFTDSYILVDYTPPQTPLGIVFAIEKEFTNKTFVNWDVPSGVQVLSTYVTSYSGAQWTNTIHQNSYSQYILSNYGSTYTTLGDPFAIFLSGTNSSQNNNLTLTLATNPQNPLEGSINNKIIYTIVKNISTFAPISTINEGCTWTLEFESGTNGTINVPSNYTGIRQCNYQAGNIVYNPNDAAAVAAFNLWSQLDLDTDGTLELEFDASAVTIELSQITGIPYPWSTEVQIRRWR
jgi:hypothetical protein